MAIAQHIVGTSIGRRAKSARALVELHTTPLENVGCVANDQLAEYLVTRLPCTHFVDVGAHIGSITAEVLRHSPKTKVTAIDPIPEKVLNLRSRFPDVEVIQAALSDHEGVSSFFINPKASGYSSLNSEAGEVEISVPLKRLDSVVSNPDLIKVDVEGAELGVLRGCEELKSRPVYMFESAPNEVLGYTKSDLWGWFHSNDYGVFVPNRLAHLAAPMGLELFIDSHEYPRRTTNYFAVPLEKIETLREQARALLDHKS